AGNKLVLKLETGSSQAAVAVQNTASVPVQTASADTKTVAKEFQFVEPTYAPKKNVAPIDPSVRSADAASKFVERPEGNLLPGMSAAMQSPEQSALQSVSQSGAAPSSTPSTPASTTSSDSSAAMPVQSAPVQPVPVQPAVNLAAEQRSHQQSEMRSPKYTGEPI